jgi:HAD superfamily hydrolase (TIGR01509 family)
MCKQVRGCSSSRNNLFFVYYTLFFEIQKRLLLSEKYMLKAVLFDMDGVLVDSETLIAEAGVALFAEKGFVVDVKTFIPFIGTGEQRFLEGVAEIYGAKVEPEDKLRLYEIYKQMVPKGLSKVRGIVTFLEYCKYSNIKTAVATSADMQKVDINFNAAGLSKDYFDVIVTGLDVERKKPYPDIYLLAAARVNCKPNECLVVEDAVNGIKAGLAAGCKCLGLTTTFAKEDLHEAHWVAANFNVIPDEAINW